MSYMVEAKTIYLKTFGCKVNQYETQVLRELFLGAGFCEGSHKKNDIYIVNSCSLTRNTDRKVRQYIEGTQRINPESKIFVIGCGVWNPESNLKNIKGIELFAGRGKKELFEKIVSSKTAEFFGIRNFEGRERAFVKVQDGCDNFCSYCVVPYLRGKPVTRAQEEILTEVKNLADNGFKEIILCGINIGKYGLERGENLAGLIKKISAVKKDFRLRISSIEPNYVTEELIDLMARERKLCPHFHLPLQSSDDKILKLMNRKYSSKDYFCLLDKIKKRIKDVSITADVLIGFPQERDENFKNTLKGIERGEFLKAHIFSYSRREQTASDKLDGHIPPKVIFERRKQAELTAQKVSYEFRKRFLNKDFDVLVENRKDKNTGRKFGFTENYIEVQVKAEDVLVNKICKASISKVTMNGNLAALAPSGCNN